MLCTKLFTVSIFLTLLLPQADKYPITVKIKQSSESNPARDILNTN